MYMYWICLFCIAAIGAGPLEGVVVLKGAFASVVTDTVSVEIALVLNCLLSNSDVI